MLPRRVGYDLLSPMCLPRVSLIPPPESKVESASPNVVSSSVESRSHTAVIPMNAHSIQIRSKFDIVNTKTILFLETVITTPDPTLFHRRQRVLTGKPLDSFSLLLHLLVGLFVNWM